MLQWMDDFTSYGASSITMLDGLYLQVDVCNLLTDPDPTAGGQRVLHMDSNSNAIMRKGLTSAQTTIGIAGRFWLSFIPSATSQNVFLHRVNDINNRLHLFLSVNPSGYLEVYRQDAAGSVLIATTTGPVLSANSWRHIEAKYVLNATTGSVEVRVEGATVILVTGIRTTSDVVGAVATASIVGMSNTFTTSGGPSIYLKDYIVWDGSGSFNTNFLGSCQVFKITPDGDNSLNWTPSTGSTGFNLVNETSPNDDTNYISAPTPAPSPAVLTLTDLPANVTSVKGVMTLHRSRKTDGGDGQMQLSLVSGANTGNGADRPITTAYTYWSDMFEQDPGATSWTRLLVNALKVKLNRTL